MGPYGPPFHRRRHPDGRRPKTGPDRRLRGEVVADQTAFRLPLPDFQFRLVLIPQQGQQRRRRGRAGFFSVLAIFALDVYVVVLAILLGYERIPRIALVPWRYGAGSVAAAASQIPVVRGIDGSLGDGRR